jgi:hypothetical protein
MTGLPCKEELVELIALAIEQADIDRNVPEGTVDHPGVSSWGEHLARAAITAIEATRPTTVVTGEHQSVGAIPGSHPADQAPSGLGASRFDPERMVAPLRRIQALAIAPGKHTGPTFDEIWALADSCLSATSGGSDGND